MLPVLSKSTAKKRIEHGPAGLTIRQWNAVEMASWGMTNQEISSKTGVSIHTVNHHLLGAYAKLGAKDRANAVRRGFELGYLKVDPR